MKVLIVGGSSSLALALKPALSRFAYVVTAGRTNCNFPIDLSAPSGEINLPPNIDVVINTAAHFGGKDADSIRQAETVNVLGTLKLCEACTRAQVKHLVLISSVFAMLDQKSPFFSAYALSKKHAEEMAQLYCATFPLALTVVRPSQLYGTGPAARKHQPFLMSLVDKAAAGEEIKLYGSHDAKRNFIHVDDVAQVIALVVQHGLQGTFNCQHPQDISYSEIATAAINAFDSCSQISFAKEQPDILDNVLPIDTALYDLIGHHPQISIAQGMAREAMRRKSGS